MERTVIEKYTIYISELASMSRLEQRMLEDLLETGLFPEIEAHLQENNLYPQDLAALRRIRQLHEAGVSFPGIELILHMRNRIQELQAELEKAQKSSAQAVRHSAWLDVWEE